ncbi:LrgB family protein [Paenibacillus sp. MMS18-CY102]|uniref:LrgB family protein n=1 Tax=Paenibacillus sp. MMS18-CY102 TaxID=2682849 RepID=UPI00136629CB|nr:LrgB family protein [Paenibacillus sp. MMS18-CY102]MWC26616.1 LrgB family protein [Paenibacillus sp. MMS18-CY102]
MNTAFLNNPVFGVSLTIGLYGCAIWLKGKKSWAHPLLVTSIALIGILLLFRIPYESYNKGGAVITFFLGPATVALAVPLYKQMLRFRKQLIPVAIGTLVGSVSGLLINGLIFMWTGASHTLLLTALPKSATSPVAIEVARMIGGKPELAAVLTVLTGLFGSVAGPWVLRSCGFRQDAAIGAGVGTASHGIGTARLLADSEQQGGISGFAMALTAIVTSMLALPLSWLF